MSAGLRWEMILSATCNWGTPPKYNVLRMSLYAGGEGVSGLLGVAVGDNRDKGERTRGEQTTGMVEEGVMRTEDTSFPILEVNC